MSSENANTAAAVLAERLSQQLTASLEVCVRCGLCAESCHYYVANPEPAHIPAYRAERLRRLYNRLYDPLSKVAPRWTGAQDLDEETLQALADAAWGTCTMCGRCVLNCPMGVDTRLIVRTARAMLTALGRTPAGLQATVDAHLATGNNMSVSREDFIETTEWLEEQLQSELGPGARIPLDKQGARVMYTLNPREVKFYPLTFLAVAKIFNAAGEDWTISSKYWDVTNYALFSGDNQAAAQIAGWLADEAERLQVQQIVMAECGHGYRSLRWEAENWLGRPFPFTVTSFVEVMADYIANGNLKINEFVHKKRITYHDPCNQARNGGIIEVPRVILGRIAADFVEMTPHGAENFCCGGGGGMLAMADYARARLAAGETKAKQIDATGAQIVATSCHNCLDQLAELKKKYKLKVEIKNLCELVADALVLPAPVAD